MELHHSFEIRNDSGEIFDEIAKLILNNTYIKFLYTLAEVSSLTH